MSFVTRASINHLLSYLHVHHSLELLHLLLLLLLLTHQNFHKIVFLFPLHLFHLQFFLTKFLKTFIFFLSDRPLLHCHVTFFSKFFLHCHCHLTLSFSLSARGFPWLCFSYLLHFPCLVSFGHQLLYFLTQLQSSLSIKSSKTILSLSSLSLFYLPSPHF